MQAGTLQSEIHKAKPFESPEQEAHLNLLRTHSVLAADWERFFRAHGISSATYNLLRILRGAKGQGADGRACHEIGEHLVAQVPDVTRLVDRAESAGLVERVRCTRDRRVVYVRITPRGLELLASLDEPVMRRHKEQLGVMTPAELNELSRLLSKARSALHVGAKDN